MLQYSGVTAATTNEPEVEEALGIRIGQNWDKVLAAGERIMRACNCSRWSSRAGVMAWRRSIHKHKPVDIPIFGSDQVAE